MQFSFPAFLRELVREEIFALQAAICSHLLGRAEYHATHVTMSKTLSSERLSGLLCLGEHIFRGIWLDDKHRVSKNG